MYKRKQGSSAESLAEALSRVMVTREELDHRENFDWATHEGRGDRMPRFLERAIQDVPHAAHQARRTDHVRYQGRSRLRRASFLMSIMGVGAGVAVSVYSPQSVGPWLEQAHAVARLATANLSFSSEAVAAMPRLRFGEALRNYSEQAAAEASRANIVVSNLTPGATLSAGEQVTDTSWSLPQSDLENLVITFPRNTPETAMHATVEIPGNTAASSGKFSVELRRAEPVDGHEAAAVEGQAAGATADEAVSPAAGPAAVAGDEPAEADDAAVRKAAAKPRSIEKAVKRKPRPSAALPAKTQKVATAPSAPAPKPVASVTAPASQVARVSADSGSASAPSLLDVFSAFAPSGLSTNAIMMNNLGGPSVE